MVWSVFFCLCVGEVTLRVIGRVQNIDYRVYAENLVTSTAYPRGLVCRFPGQPYHSLCPGFAGVASTSDFTVVYKTNSQGLRDK